MNSLLILCGKSSEHSPLPHFNNLSSFLSDQGPVKPLQSRIQKRKKTLDVLEPSAVFTI